MFRQSLINVPKNLVLTNSEVSSCLSYSIREVCLQLVSDY